jgi:hypothetical protein
LSLPAAPVVTAAMAVLAVKAALAAPEHKAGTRTLVDLTREFPRHIKKLSPLLVFIQKHLLLAQPIRAKMHLLNFTLAHMQLVALEESVVLVAMAEKAATAAEPARVVLVAT